MRNKFLTGMTVVLPVFVLFFTGCPTDGEDETVDNKLIGKWEWEKMIFDGEEFDLPYEMYGVLIMDKGGYEFTKNSATSFTDGKKVGTFTAYTRNKTIYINGQAAFEYTLDGNTLRTLIDSESGVVSKKVTKFSWE